MAKSREGQTEARVEFIAQLMRDLKFRRGETSKELALTWKLNLNTVKEMSARASKMILAEVSDPERVKETVGAHLLRVMEDAYACGDRKSVIAAGKTWADITIGRKFQVTQTHDVSKLSDEDLAKLAEEHIAALKKPTK